MIDHDRCNAMANNDNPTVEPGPTMVYQIRVRGHLDRRWAGWFDGWTITQEEDGESLLTGPVVDQAALYGLLRKVRDVGLPLVSVIAVEPERTEAADGAP